MVDLTVTGTSESGEHLLVSGPDGTEYRLAVDETLRAALRRAAATTRGAAGVPPLRPRDIQALLRAGHEADEIADDHGIPRERVLPFEPPVLAERTFVAQQARAQRVGHDSDSPTLGDLVVDRLAARGVDVDRLSWDARRSPGEPWRVGVTFVAAHKERTALWRIDLQARTLVAVDDEARWLSETDVSPGSRHGGPVDTPFGARRRGAEPPWAREANDARAPEDPAPAAGTPAEPGTAADNDPTEALLKDLAAHRGTRQDLDDDVTGELDLDSLTDEEDGDDIPAAHPPASRPDLARDAQVLSLDAHRRSRPADGPDPDAPAVDPRGTHPSGRGRTTTPRETDDEEVDLEPTGSAAPGADEAAPEHGATVPEADETAPGADGTAPGDAAADEDSSPVPATDGDAVRRPGGADTIDDESPADGTSADEAGKSSPAPESPTAPARKSAPAAKPARPAARKSRRSVPSWDEIVFGSRSDPSE